MHSWGPFPVHVPPTFLVAVPVSVPVPVSISALDPVPLSLPVPLSSSIHVHCRLGGQPFDLFAW